MSWRRCGSYGSFVADDLADAGKSPLAAEAVRHTAARLRRAATVRPPK
jgi:hypothetical protein